MNFVSFLIVSVSTFTISFSVEATQSTQPYSRPPAHRKLQANESYIFQRLRTPFSFLQITRILEITTFFENSKLQAEYTYVEDLSDGRGFTAGRVGFCTGTGDLAEVVESYCLVQPKIQLCRFLPRLREISAVAEAQHQPNPDVRGLDQFSKAWTSASNDKKFQQQQDHALMEMYLNPALDYFKRQNLKWPISLSVLYDTFIQHGDGGPDGFKFIFDKTNHDLSDQTYDERQWLNQFLRNRIQILLNPSNHDTADEWRESVTRAYKLQSILNEDHNYLLNRPVQFEHKTTTD